MMAFTLRATLRIVLIGASRAAYKKGHLEGGREYYANG